MLTKEEIKKIKDAAIIITVEDAVNILKTGKIKIIPHTHLNNGYLVGYSITHLRPGVDIHHISVSNPKGSTDPADAEHIAKDILVEYESMGPMNLKNVLHFTRLDKGPNNDS